MEHSIKKRIDNVRKALQKEKMEALMVLVEQNRRYLSGFTGEDTQFDENAGVLFITAQDLILATDSRYQLQAQNEAPLYEVICYKKGIEKEMPSIVERLNIRKLGFESVRLSFSQYQKILHELDEHQYSQIDLVASENIVEKLRMVKEQHEIQAVKDALIMAENVFYDLIEHLKPGMTEKEVAWQMEKRMREKGADALSFPTIVASGPNSALPHAVPTKRRIKEGEPLLFDWGVKLNGYCSDISRTVILGRPDDHFKKVFQTVYEAQQKAIEAMKPGMTGKEVDNVARSFIDGTEFKGKFSHGLGHGTGLAVHEAPRLSPLKEDLLEPGMIFTVEPGIYISDWGGIRLENMVVMRDDGPEVLNESDPAFYLLKG